MRRVTLPEDVTNAFATIARFVVDLVREVASETANRDDSAAYYDAKTCPMAPTTFRRAAAAGAFPAFRVGRKLMAKKADVDAWIATQKRTTKPKPQATDDDDAAFFASLQPQRPRR